MCEQRDEETGTRTEQEMTEDDGVGPIVNTQGRDLASIGK
jgi:hypothetical protein